MTMLLIIFMFVFIHVCVWFCIYVCILANNDKMLIIFTISKNSLIPGTII